LTSGKLDHKFECQDVEEKTCYIRYIEILRILACFECNDLELPCIAAHNGQLPRRVDENVSEKFCYPW